jgi:membrane-bound metal-dependent hydrolase YbcI (DUF457 family)
MLPWGHLAVGYLLYSLGVRLRYRQPPPGPAVIALAVGTQAPDLIDKPLAWTFEILPSGRSLGHSLLFAALLGAVVWTLGKRYDRRPAALAFLIGYLTHVIVDVLPAVRAGQWEIVGTLLWPVLPAYVYPGELDRGILEFLLALEFAALPWKGIVAGVLAFGLWVYDGRPGVQTILGALRAKHPNYS